MHELILLTPMVLPIRFQFVAIEDYATTVKEGDAKTTSKLVIDNDYIDSDNSWADVRKLYTRLEQNMWQALHIKTKSLILEMLRE